MNEQVKTISIVYDGKNIMPCINGMPIDSIPVPTVELRMNVLGKGETVLKHKLVEEVANTVFKFMVDNLETDTPITQTNLATGETVNFNRNP